MGKNLVRTIAMMLAVVLLMLPVVGTAPLLMVVAVGLLAAYLVIVLHRSKTAEARAGPSGVFLHRHRRFERPTAFAASYHVSKAGAFGSCRGSYQTNLHGYLRGLSSGYCAAANRLSGAISSICCHHGRAGGSLRHLHVRESAMALDGG